METQRPLSLQQRKPLRQRPLQENDGLSGQPTAQSLAGACVGFRVGRRVGARVGRLDGLRVGARVGRLVGRRVGARVGLFVGRRVGARVGLLDGLRVGARVGLFVGRRVGARVGCRDGARVGARLGTLDGRRVGEGVRISQGVVGGRVWALVGDLVGVAVPTYSQGTVGDLVGAQGCGICSQLTAKSRGAQPAQAQSPQLRFLTFPADPRQLFGQAAVEGVGDDGGEGQCLGPEITPRTANLLMVCVAGYRFSQQPTEPAACSVVRNEKCVQSALAAHRAWHSAAVCALESVEMSFPFVLPKLMSASKHSEGTSAGAAVEGGGNLRGEGDEDVGFPQPARTANRKLRPLSAVGGPPTSSSTIASVVSANSSRTVLRACSSVSSSASRGLSAPTPFSSDLNITRSPARRTSTADVLPELVSGWPSSAVRW